MKNTQPGPELNYLAGTARRLNMSQTQLRRHVANGDIGFVNLGAGTIRRRIAFTEEQIQAFLQSRTVAPAQSKPAPGSDHE